MIMANTMCYFCHSNHTTDHGTGPGANWCLDCQEKYNLHAVISNYHLDSLGDDSEGIERTQIYVSYGKALYYFNWHAKENYTQLRGDGGKFQLNIPGQIISPENATEKLKLYILFS